jgi:hypothetical protein
MTNVHRKLTKELLALYIKYGAREFNSAIKELRESNIGGTVADAAEAVVELLRDSRPRSVEVNPLNNTPPKSLSSRDRLVHYIQTLESGNDRRKADVAGVTRKILNREALQSPNMIRDYMFRSGIPLEEKKLDRYRATRKIAEYLLALSPQEADEQIRAIEQMREASSSLQKWTDVIVKPDHDR